MVSKKKKSIVFLVNNLGIGGAQKILLFLANKCAVNGFKVSIVALSKIDNTMPICDDINIYYVGYETKDEAFKGILRRRTEQVLSIIRLRKIIKSIYPDLIVTFQPRIIRYVLYATHSMNISIIGSERDNPYILSNKQLQKNDRIYQKCSAVVFQTERAKDIFSETVHKKSYVIPNPSIPRIKSIEPYFGDRRQVFTAAGRLDEVKQFDILIKAFKIVAERHKGYKLHIYGEGTERATLEDIIVRENLKEIVILKGKVNDVFSIEYDCSGFILSSKSEGIPNVLIEAMAIGLPCISTDCEPGGPRMLFADGKRGTLVPVGDIESLANAICNYIENPTLAKKMGLSSVEINNELDRDSIFLKWNELFNSIINKSQS